MTATIKLTISKESSLRDKKITTTIKLENDVISALDALDTIKDFYDYKISDYEAQKIIRTAIRTGSAAHTE